MTEGSLRAQWNAVHVAGGWRLVDVLWASACVKKEQHSEWVLVNMDNMDTEDEEEEEDDQIQHIMNDFFFLTDPDMMVCTHFPDDPQWQLLPRPVSMKKFETYVYVRERFFQMGLKMSSQSRKHCVLRTIRGVVSLGFSIPDVDSSNLVFRFLFYALKNNERCGSGFSLDQYVLYEKTVDTLHYTIRFPRAGCFRMDVFGQDKCKHKHQDLVCSYVIECDEAQPNCRPLPDSPDIGWGVTCEASQLGLVPLTHPRAVVMSDTGTCELRFRVEEPLVITYSLKAGDHEEFLLRQSAVMWWEDQDVVVFQTRFTDSGAYALKIFAAREESSHSAVNVCNYLIEVQGDATSNATFPVLRGGIIGRSSFGAHYQVEPITHERGSVRVHDKSLQLTMRSLEGVQLLAEITNNDIDTKILSANATRLQSPGETTFELNLPKYGEYAVNIFAHENDDPKNIHHVYTYLVHCEAVEGEEAEHDEVVYDSPPLLIPTSVCTAKSDVITTYSRRPQTVVGNLVQRRDTRNKPKARIKDANSNKAGQKRTDDEVLKLTLQECAEYDLLLFEENAGMLQVFGSVEIQKGDQVHEVLLFSSRCNFLNMNSF